MENQTDPLHATVFPFVSGDETIRWLGKPNPLHAAKKVWMVSLFGLIFGAFAFFIFSKMRSFGDTGFTLSPRPDPSPVFNLFFSAIALVFAIVILRFVFAPLWEYLIALGRVYAITNERVLIIERFPSDDTKSYYPGDIKYIQVKGKEIGDVTFNSEMKMVTQYEHQAGRDEPRAVRRKVRVSIGFFDLPEPNKAAAFLRELKDSLKQTQ